MIRAYPIPFSEFARLLRFYPRGHVVRVMCLMLAFTGCRPSELERMYLTDGPDGCGIKNNHIYWLPGKRQTGYRKEFLPEWYIQELEEYRRTHRVYENKIFGIKYSVCRRYLHKDRVKIGGLWTERQEGPINKSYIGKADLKLQLKGFRKSFGSVIFKDFWEEFGDAGAAVQFTCQRMGHSNMGITVGHYIAGFRGCDVDRWRRWLKQEENIDCQTRIGDFNPVKPRIIKSLLATA